MQYLGHCCECSRLALLTRYKADGSKDWCIRCKADEKYERLMGKKEEAPDGMQGM